MEVGSWFSIVKTRNQKPETMRILIVTGEASSDLYGSLLARELRALRPDVQLDGAGSDRMAAQGVTIVDDPTKYASIGIVEAFKNFKHYRNLMRVLTERLATHRPDVVVLIDFPDFNLRFGPRAKALGIPVVYYISPQVWAWRESRVRDIAALVRKMLVIFPFEVEFYKKAGVDAEFVGHPLCDIVAERPGVKTLCTELGFYPGAPVVGLLPGSRRKQFDTLGPMMVDAARLIERDVPNVKFVVAGARTISDEHLKSLGLPYVHDRTADVLETADAVITASGTATVEAALHGTPMVVTYWVNPVAAMLLGPFIKIDNYAMVNILAGRTIVPELYQKKATPENLARATVAILRGGAAEMKKGLAEVKAKLGGPGAGRRAAEAILSAVSSR